MDVGTSPLDPTCRIQDHFTVQLAYQSDQFYP